MMIVLFAETVAFTTLFVLQYVYWSRREGVVKATLLRARRALSARRALTEEFGLSLEEITTNANSKGSV